MNRRISLEAQYNLTYADKATKVKDRYPTPGTERTVLPNAWAYAQSLGLSADTFRELRLFTATMWDATWMYEAPSNVGKFLNAFNFVEVPAGSFLSNAPVIVPRAGMCGQSSFFYAGQGGDQGQVASEIDMDDVWLVPGNERRLLDTPNSSGTAGNFSYNESMTISQLRLQGPAVYGDGITRIGLFLSWMGECTYVNQVRADRFQHGFVARGGVPLTCGTLTAFYNEVGGFSGLGTSLATINIQTLSGDSNGRLLNLAPGYNTPGGGIVNVGLIKSEDGITGNSRTSNQVAVWAEGQYALNIGVVSFANQGTANPEAMFVINPTLGGGANQASVLNVGAAIGFGYGTMLVNKVTGSRWATPGGYNAFQFTHYAKWDKLVSGCEDLVKSTGTPTPTPTPMPTPTPTPTPTPAPTGALPRAGWVATAYRSNSASELPGNAINGDTTKHWTNGQAMTADGTQWLQVDMGAAQQVSRLTVAVRPDKPNDFPRSLRVQVSNDGTTWTTVATVQGAATTTATWAARSARYVRMAPLAAASSWWSVDEVYLYR